MSCKPILAVCAVLLAVNPTAPRPAAAGSNWTLQMDLRGHRIEGTPVHLTDSHALLLGRDGQLWSFAPSEAKNFRKVSSTFRGYSHGEIRGELMREFGRRYEVAGTGHYLVVHPAGQRDQWADRFEQLYRSFVHYFTARGIRPQPPQFPLVAVVFPTKRDFHDHLRTLPGQPSSAALGYYFTGTNRVLLYDTAGGNPRSQNWQVNAGTIIHEATHQTAFNTGIHNRLNTTPAWVAEGLATMFEAPGVWDPRHHPHLAQRINRYRMDRFRAFLERGQKDWLPKLVASDAAFGALSDTAYAQAWALTFYLMEKQPRQHGNYLKKTARRPAGQKYTTQERFADFTSVFGTNSPMLEARVERFVAELPK